MKRFEGLRRKSARLADGGWTIGYGHSRSAREGAEVTAEEAEALLIYDLRRVAEAVTATVYTPLNQNQFDALCVFAFNIGVDNFVRSAVLKRLNEGSYLQAAAALELWRKADFDGEDIVVDALVRRRAAEKALFLTPDDGFRPTPTPVLRVMFDPSLMETLEQRRAGLASPVVLNAALDGDLATLEREAEPFTLTGEEPEAPPVATDEDGQPSAALAAAAKVRARLERLMGEDEPVQPETSSTSPQDLSFPEPVNAPEAEPEPPAAEVRAEPEPEPPPPPLFDPLAWRPQAPAAVVDPPETLADTSENGFGRRSQPVRYKAYPSSSAAPRRNRTPYGAPMLILGLVGAALFSGSIVAMLGGKATFAMLAIGLVGVICMAPAGIRYLLNQIGPEPSEPMSE